MLTAHRTLHQVLSPLRPASPYEDDVDEAALQPSRVGELLLECFAAPSGAALGVPAAAAPLLLMLWDDGELLAYKVRQQC